MRTAPVAEGNLRRVPVLLHLAFRHREPASHGVLHGALGAVPWCERVVRREFLAAHVLADFSHPRVRQTVRGAPVELRPVAKRTTCFVPGRRNRVRHRHQVAVHAYQARARAEGAGFWSGLGGGVVSRTARRMVAYFGGRIRCAFLGIFAIQPRTLLEREEKLSVKHERKAHVPRRVLVVPVALSHRGRLRMCPAAREGTSGQGDVRAGMLFFSPLFFSRLIRLES